MAFWNRNKSPENPLSISPEKQQPPAAKLERQSNPVRERGAELRRSVWHKFTGALKSGAEVGQKLVNGFDRVVGGGLEAYDSAKKGVGIVAEAYGRASQWAGEAPDKLMDEAGVLLVKGAEKAGRGISAAGAKGWEGANKGIDTFVAWEDIQVNRAEAWVGKQYESLSGWAGKQAESFQTSASEAKASFLSGVDRVRNWKDKTLAEHRQRRDAAYTARIEAQFAKLSPEAQKICKMKFEQVKGNDELKADLAGAA